MALPVTLDAVAARLRAAGQLAGVKGDTDTMLGGVSQDSRAVEPGDLFLAWRGLERDGHDFVADAVRAGAAAVVLERELAGVGIPQLLVHDGRLAGALAADTVFGSPWKELFAVAVTGTNGKTTTALLARHLLGENGPAAALGTLGVVGPDGGVWPGTEGLTTPGPVRLAGLLRALADDGVKSVVLEASSHALEQRRMDALRVDVAVFTNLTQDHLDYHGDMEAYFGAKAKLVSLVEDGGCVVVNAGDPAWRRLPEGPRRLTFAVEDEADLRASALEARPGGTRFRLTFAGRSVEVELPLPGRFNVENALGAAAAALVAGVPLPAVAERLAGAPQVPGRLEVVYEGPFTVVIDFAHTPDALRGVLDALRPLARGRLVVLFGAGGDRDRTKRRPMAEAVGSRADHVVLTSDNPRTENPDAILNDLEPGLAGVSYERVADRREAIARALRGAGPGDVVLLAGKGHERYQIVGTEKRPFDERAVVRESLGEGAA